MNIDREKQVVEQMIRLYCNKKENNNELCPSCTELLDYAIKRLNHCPFGNKKKACKNCNIHCYNSEMRQQIKKVMRYSGPRMLFYSPMAAIQHLLNK